MSVRRYEGTFQPPSGSHFALVASRFNHLVVDRLVEGALDCLRRHGVDDDRVHLAYVPGAFELPWVCKRMARSENVAAVIALGAVIRGATSHFDYVAGEAARGCAAVALETDTPVAFGVLTTDTVEQALERAGTKAGNKGWEAALSALEAVSLDKALESDGF